MRHQISCFLISKASFHQIAISKPRFLSISKNLLSFRVNIGSGWIWAALWGKMFTGCQSIGLGVSIISGYLTQVLQINMHTTIILDSSLNNLSKFSFH